MDGWVESQWKTVRLGSARPRLLPGRILPVEAPKFGSGLLPFQPEFASPCVLRGRDHLTLPPESDRLQEFLPHSIPTE